MEERFAQSLSSLADAGEYAPREDQTFAEAAHQILADLTREGEGDYAWLANSHDAASHRFLYRLTARAHRAIEALSRLEDESRALSGAQANSIIIYYLKIIMLDAHADMRIVFICCSFVSAVIGTAGYVFGIGSTPELALGASVLYLIPGIPYINSVSDMIDNHHLCAFARFVNAVILTVCIAIGLTGGFLIMNIRLF